MAADPTSVYGAFVDEATLTQWLPPGDMSAAFERFDPRPGGSYRLVLTYAYADRASARGKSTTDADVVEARFVELVPGVRVVQEVDFESDDPAFQGTMVMTWQVTPTEGGTLVEFIASNVPDGISAEDHAEGLHASLTNLARYLEAQQHTAAPAAASRATSDTVSPKERSGGNTT